MPELRLIYIAGFNTDGDKGRSKATREKACALKQLSGIKNFLFLYPKNAKNRLLLYFYMFTFDVLLLFKLAGISNKTVVIQRQVFFPLTIAWLKLRRINVISEVHTEAATEIPHLPKSGIEKLLLYAVDFFERYNQRLSKGIIYNHPDLQKVMSRRLNKPSIVSYNGANAREELIRDEGECRLRLGLDLSKKYYLFLGSFAKWRGLEDLIEVFQQPLFSPQHELLMVGADHSRYARELRKLAEAKARIRLIDAVPFNTAVDYINASDLCLVPVKKIMTTPGNALKLYDYISSGKPVCTQEYITGYADEVLQYDLGMVTDFSDPPRAARELTAFVTNLDKNYFRQHNREAAATELSWTSRMENWLRFISGI